MCIGLAGFNRPEHPSHGSGLGPTVAQTFLFEEMARATFSLLKEASLHVRDGFLACFNEKMRSDRIHNSSVIRRKTLFPLLRVT